MRPPVLCWSSPTDDEEACLAAAIDSADKELDVARQKLATANQEFSQLKSRIEQLAKAIGIQDTQLKSSEETFLVRLKESGFTGHDLLKYINIFPSCHIVGVSAI